MGQGIAYFELGSRDHRVLVDFYRELFGWRAQDIGDTYTIVDTQAGSGLVGGIGRSSDGTPWVSFYVLADDPQATLDKAVSMGGKVVVPVTEVPGVVTFAMFTDPDGLLVGIAAPGAGGGTVSPGDGVPVDWFEVLGSDAERTQRFYSELFGWKLNDAGSPATAWSTHSPARARSAAGSGAAAGPATGRPSMPACRTWRRPWPRPSSSAAPGYTGPTTSTTTCRPAPCATPPATSSASTTTRTTTSEPRY